MFCRRAEAQAFGYPAEQLRRENIEQSAPVIEHEYKTKRSKSADYYIENIGREYDLAPARQNGADGAHGIIEHSEQKADAERMQKDGYLAVQPLDILHQRNTRLKIRLFRAVRRNRSAN